MGEQKLEDVRKKARIFFEKHIFVFAKAIKPDGNYELRNGYIIEQPSEDFFTIEDYKTKEYKPIFFIDLARGGGVLAPSRVEEGEYDKPT